MEMIRILGGGARRCLFCVALAGSFAAAAVTRMDYPDANTVLLDDITRVEYAADGTFVIENDERILALTDKGRRSLRSTTLSVSRRYGTAEIVKVEIIGTNGVVRPVDFRAGARTSENGCCTFWPHIDGTDGFFAAKLKRELL